MVLKQNVGEAWGIEAGKTEVKYYQTAAKLDPSPPGLVPCYASAYDSVNGNSYLLLQDLSKSHVPPVTRDQQISIISSVPSSANVERVVDALAEHHAYWWNHPLLHTETFPVGYWTCNEDRFTQYLRKRFTAWESLRENESLWFPRDLRDLYDSVFAGLHKHWEIYLEPRFSTNSQLTLLHGDAYFANFMCPRATPTGTTYILDWQSPVVDIAGYDLANLCATFWTSEQRNEEKREEKALHRYLRTLQTCGVAHYTWEDLVSDYQAGLIYWLLVPVQDRYDGSSREYWWPKMECLVAAFREWHCADLLGMFRT